MPGSRLGPDISTLARHDETGALVRPPVDNDEPPVVPFTKEQVAAILKACGDNEYLRTKSIVSGGLRRRRLEHDEPVRPEHFRYNPLN